MITPPYLKTGDTVGLVAPARFSKPDEIKTAIGILKEWGLNVILGKHIFTPFNQFAGKDEERSEDFQEMLDDTKVKAILCVRGGYGSVRTLQKLNFEKFRQTPKWITGYSDVTIFHSFVNARLNCETLHSPMPFNFRKSDFDKGSISLMKEFLFGRSADYEFNRHDLNMNGEAEGILTGGNLSVLYSLRGTPADIETDGRILFLEDLDEYLYHVDRMLMNFKYGGKLNNLNGVIIGDMSDMKDNTIPFGKNAYEIVADVLSELKVPICFGFPAGHGDKNYPLIMGRKIRLTVSDNCSIKFIK